MIEDQRLDRARPVTYLDRRTHRGDPPTWLPTYWSKPGIYSLSPESVSIIKMVSSFPFDRHVTSSSSQIGMLGSGQPLFQPHLHGMAGNPTNMMTQPMSPMINMMHPLLQQQQHMLQYQQQQFQAMPVSPMTPSPSPSSYTQRKPITTCISNPLLPFASSSPAPNHSQKQSSPSKIQRKLVKKSLSTEKRRVRFTEDQPQVNIFEPDMYSMDFNHFDEEPIPTTRQYGSDDDDEYYFSDDDHHGSYEAYDELDYDQRHYPDHDYYSDNNYYHSDDGYYEEGDNTMDHYCRDDNDGYYYYYSDEKEQRYQQPRSSFTGFDHDSPPQQRRYQVKRRHSAPIQPQQQQQHHTPMARRPTISSANPRMWQPSRGNHQQS